MSLLARLARLDDAANDRLSDADLEEWLVKWIPLERDRLFRAWEEAATDEARVRHEVEDGTTHGGWIWFFAAITDRCREELASHDRFAEWAKGWLTDRWQARMRQLVELW